MDIIQFLSGFSIAALAPAVLVWTLVAGLVLIVLRFTAVIQPLMRYHLSTAIILALPVGIAAGYLFDFSWIQPASIPAIAALPVLEMQPIIVWGGTPSTGVASTGGTALSWVNLVSLLILTAAFAGILRLLFIYFRLMSACRNAKTVISHYEQSILSDVKTSLGIRRNIALKTMQKATIPFTTGFFRPVIILPENYPTDEKNLRIILTHEAIHIARNDYALHFMELVVRHVFWLHPLVHLLYRQSAYWREVSCDTCVLKTCNPDAGTYAQLLYEFAITSNEKPVFKAAMAEESNLLRRIRAFSTQTNTKKEVTMKKSLIIAGVLLLVLGGAMACSDMTNYPKVAENKMDMSELDAIKSINDDGIVIYRIGNQYLTEESFSSLITRKVDALKSRTAIITAYSNNTEREEIGETFSRLLENIETTIETYSKIKKIIDSGHIDEAVLRFLEVKNQLNEIKKSDQYIQPSDISLQAEQMPQMIGGQEALFSVLTYPQEAREAGHQGRVIVQFVVDKEGNVIDPTVVRSSEHPALDNAAIEAIQQVQFEPGMQDNQPVNVQMVQPVVFRLQ